MTTTLVFPPPAADLPRAADEPTADAHAEHREQDLLAWMSWSAAVASNA